MCGIVAAVARDNIVPALLEGLHRLEYRGYDSAGLALLNGKLNRIRTTGRVTELSKLVNEQKYEGKIGIAHTRWATHGVPSERNAHPHFQVKRRRLQWYITVLSRIMRRCINSCRVKDLSLTLIQIQRS